jgi:hypothetical protein
MRTKQTRAASAIRSRVVLARMPWTVEVVATIHGVLWMAAELLGLYIVLVAGTNMLPQRLCFKRWKLWMRAELILWSIVLLSVWKRTMRGT